MNYVRKHWKKFLLATFTAFWSSCDSTTSSNAADDKDDGVKSSGSRPSAKSSSSKSDFEKPIALYGAIYEGGDMPIALYGPPCVLNGTPCPEPDLDGPEINCYAVSEEKNAAIKCDDGQEFDSSKNFAREAFFTRQSSNKNFASNCSEIKEECKETYGPGDSVSYGCEYEGTCPTKPEDDR